MEVAADLVRAALTETLQAKPGEPFPDALNRAIDARTAYNRWYRKVGRAIAAPFAAVFTREISE